MDLEFKDEMLIPQINGEVYFQIYEIENWLRRICLTAYMVQFGTNWLQYIPNDVLNSFKSKAKRNEDFFYLDIDTNDNVIWAATHAELMKLILNDTLSEKIKRLTGFTKSTLFQKLDELRIIRNTLAHNHPLTSTTATIIKGTIASLFQGIKLFKERILYHPGRISQAANGIIAYFDKKMEGNDWSKFQAYLSLDNGIYSLVCLPTPDRSATYPRAHELILFYKKVLDEILAFTCNKDGDEYCILFPEATDDMIKKNIIDVFIRSRNESIGIWTNTRFEEQNPKYVCNPKIWFYENQRPLEE